MNAKIVYKPPRDILGVILKPLVNFALMCPKGRLAPAGSRPERGYGGFKFAQYLIALSSCSLSIL
jgi:hypothetical protein